MNQRRNRTSKWRLFGRSRRKPQSGNGGFMNMFWTVVPVLGFIGTLFWGDNFWNEKLTDLTTWARSLKAEEVTGMLEDGELPPLPGLLPSSGSSNSTSSGQGNSKAGRFDRERGHFAKCSGRKRVTCVVDGDTIWYKGEKIRLADINAPETGQPECPSERALGERATQRLIVLMNQGSFSLGSNPFGKSTDFYGRKLATVTRGGESLGMKLVKEGLAEEWKGRRSSWC